MSMTDSNRIVKADAVRGYGTKIAFNYDDLRASCDDHLERVREQTRQLISEASAEADAIRSQAAEGGRRAGYDEGLRDADREVERRTDETARNLVADRLNSLLPALQATADALVLEKDRWRSEWEAIGVRLSIAIAEKLVHRQLDLAPEIARESLTEVLELAAGQPRLSIRLHPRDVTLLGDQAEDVIGSLSSCADVSIIPDESVSPGGCFIETQHGTIDARLQTQLDRIAHELLDQND